MDDSDKQNKPRFRITEGILLALIPAVGYFLAFSFEKGFSKHFNIPVEFIRIDLIDLLSFTGILIGVLTIIVLLTFLLDVFFWPNRYERTDSAFRNRIVTFLLSSFLLLVALPIAFLGFLAWRRWIWMTLVFLYFVVLELVYPLFSQRKIPGYANKLAAQVERDVAEPSIFKEFAKRYGGGLFLIILGIIFFVGLTEQAGEATAENQREFLILRSSPEMVILRIYGDNMIVAPFDRKTQEVESEFVIKILGEDDNLVISPEDVGPLTLTKPSPTPTPTSTPSPTPTLTLTPSPTATATPSP